MAAQAVYPHVRKSEGEPAPLERLPRVRVAQIVMDHLAYGWSADEICRHHPNLQLAEVHAAMTYYYDHREEIDQEVVEEVEEANADLNGASGSPLRVRLCAKRLL